MGAPALLISPHPPSSSCSTISDLLTSLQGREGVKEKSLWGCVKCHIILLPPLSLRASTTSLPLVCPHRSRRRCHCCCWGHRGSRWWSRMGFDCRRGFPEDQGARCDAAAASGGPLERRQVRGSHRAGAEDAQIHRAQHHCQVSA